MHSIYSDDQLIIAKLLASSGKRNEELVSAKVMNKKDVTLAESEHKVVVELTGAEIGRKRSCGLDLVIVMEVSWEMKGMKMTKLKSAIKFLIKKLSPIDRLSIITFSTMCTRLCPLLSMTDMAGSKVEQLVCSLQPNGGTDILGGLQMGLRVLEDRRQKAGRASAIMLFSGGIQSFGYGDPTQIPLYDIPVHTFGFGDDHHDASVLKTIAERSKTGTFSSVVDLDGLGGAGLSIAVSTCLAGLLTEVVQQLELNISSKMKIEKVNSGSYVQREDGNGSITILFGNLYYSEKRTVLVSLRLPVANCPTPLDVLTITYSFRASGREAHTLFEGKFPHCYSSVKDHSSYKSPAIKASVSRTNSTLSPECKAVAMEEGRQLTMAKITEALKNEAESEDEGDEKVHSQRRCDHAKRNLKRAEKILDNIDENDGNNKMIIGLKYEVRELQKLVQNKHSFEKSGYSFGLASVLSHNLQRFALKGEADMKIIKYATPIATVFAKQARKFNTDWHIPVPKIEQDLDELALDRKYYPRATDDQLDKTPKTHKVHKNIFLDEMSDDGKTKLSGTVDSAKEFSATSGGDDKERIIPEKVILIMVLVFVSWLFVVIAMADSVSLHFENVTRCLKALKSLASAVQSLFPGVVMSLAVVNHYFNNNQSSTLISALSQTFESSRAC